MDPKPQQVSVAAVVHNDSVGESLAQGRYVIFEQLGQGSQADTWRAVDKRDGTTVAIKRFSVGHAKSWKDVELAEREAHTLASLQHPALPRYIDHFEEQGNLYLVMECVEGYSLAAYAKRGERLGLVELRLLAQTLSDVLGYLHTRVPPVIHRDIKPGNIIRRPDGTFCLVDFGSVRDGLRPEGGSTVVGTFGYMAPEQFQGRALPATDVYAVGALLLALITGKSPDELPHSGLSIDTRAAIGGAVPNNWVDMIAQLVNINPDERPSRLAPLLEQLDGVAPTETSAPAVDSSAPPWHEPEREPDSSFTVMVGSGFGLLPLVALTIARIAIWVALGVAVPLVLRILSIFFGARLRDAAAQVSQAGLHARTRLADATRYLQHAEPFVLQGRHYAAQQRRDMSTRAEQRSQRKAERRAWRRAWKDYAREVKRSGASWQSSSRVDVSDFVNRLRDDIEDQVQREVDGKFRRGGQLFSDDANRTRAGKTNKPGS